VPCAAHSAFSFLSAQNSHSTFDRYHLDNTLYCLICATDSSKAGSVVDRVLAKIRERAGGQGGIKSLARYVTVVRVTV
jgi:hypothetical protein